MTLADLSSFLGSIWFGVALGFAGYLAGNVFPVSKIASLFRK